MDKLEQYLDQVCRCIGGPRALRQHVRQELREHLLDAVARHQAAGLSAEEAREKALAEFGAPEEVRSELEATHGQRLFAVVLDKALHWKEMTMRAKWLWTTLANLGMLLLIGLEILFIVFQGIFIVPKFKKLVNDGLIDLGPLAEGGVAWMPKFLFTFYTLLHEWTWALLLGPIAAWALFEWRVKSDNKAFMRMAGLGTVAVGLMVIVWLVTASLIIPFCVGVPSTWKLARAFAMDQIAKAETAVTALEQALAQKDWAAMSEPADRAAQALDSLLQEAPALPALLRHAPDQFETLRNHLQAATIDLKKAKNMILLREQVRLEQTVQQVRRLLAPVRAVANRQER